MLCINLLSKRRGYLYKVSKVQWAPVCEVYCSERTDPHPDSRVATAVSRVRPSVWRLHRPEDPSRAVHARREMRRPDY